MLAISRNYLAAIRAGLRSSAAWQVWPALIAVSLAAAACGDRSTTASTSAPAPAIFFPQQKAVDGERVSMEALLAGKLALVEGCLYVHESQTGVSYLLVWPPDSRLNVQDGAIQILDGAGQVVARVGDEIHVSGGEVASFEHLNEYLRQTLPDDCPGPYWIVGEEIRSES